MTNKLDSDLRPLQEEFNELHRIIFVPTFDPSDPDNAKIIARYKELEELLTELEYDMSN